MYAQSMLAHHAISAHLKRKVFAAKTRVSASVPDSSRSNGSPNLFANIRGRAKGHRHRTNISLSLKELGEIVIRGWVIAPIDERSSVADLHGSAATKSYPVKGLGFDELFCVGGNSGDHESMRCTIIQGNAVNKAKVTGWRGLESTNRAEWDCQFGRPVGKDGPKSSSKQ